ncbi:MAG: HD domain-containing protein, partial [Treponema sp.]|nr:HD domain-containing protein [Treponema sp.]
GGGSTEVMLLRQGRMAAAHSIKMGTIQIDRRMRMRSSPGLLNERYLREAVRDTIGLLNAEMDMKSVRTMVMAGADARMVAAQAGKRLNEHCFLVEREDFVAFAEEARGYVPGDCMRKLGMAYADAEGFVPGIMALKLFLEETDATQAVIPLVSIREGCLIDIALGLDEAMQEEFHSQIVASAVSMTEKFNCDQAHSTHVAALSVALFDALANEHGMKRRQRVMLEVAAILHDIGTFIKTSGHNRHGYYIVANSEIFGLTRDELDVIACVVRYHRGDPPAESDPEYASLPSERRVLVLKMAALLRVADALDRGHSQKIKSLAVERHASTVSLRCEGVHDIALELVSVEEKADLFQDVFGCSLALS